MWVFKADSGKYLHDFKVGHYGRIDDIRWTDSQMFAWRFFDRNAASVVSMKLMAAGRLKALTSSGVNKRIAAIEAANREVKKDLAAAVAMLRMLPLPGPGQVKP